MKLTSENCFYVPLQDQCWTKATEENWPGPIHTLYEKYNLHHPDRVYKHMKPPVDYPIGAHWFDEADTGL